MLVLPRIYQQAQSQLRKEKELGTFGPLKQVNWTVAPELVERSKKMLLVHQTGSVRVSEVVRYFIQPYSVFSMTD